MAFWSALALLPDADVIGFQLGVTYGSVWGHRGATHSFAFAIFVGMLTGLATRFARGRVARSALTTGIAAALVVATHPLLDTLTNGGRGCALFWPFETTRYFAPVNPIPVAPIGLAMFSAYGAVVAFTETVLFSPLFAFALWPFVKRRGRIGVARSTIRVREVREDRGDQGGNPQGDRGD
jgi:inner membrane protein